MRHDILYSFLSPERGRILCDNTKILVGNADGVAVPVTGIPVGLLPDLTLNKMWVGNSSNRPIEQVYVGDATFVIRLPESNLANAQAISPLGLGLLKVIADGFLALADPLTDYATVAFAAPLVTAGGVALLEAEANALIVSGLVLPAALSAAAAAQSAIDARTYRENADAALAPLFVLGLNSLPNHGDVNIQGYRVTNVKQSPEGDFDAVGFTFLWDLMNGQVEITE